MQLFSFAYDGEASLGAARVRVTGIAPDHMLIQVFCGTPDEAYIMALRAELQ